LATVAGLEGIGEAMTTRVVAGVGVETGVGVGAGTIAPPVCAAAEDGNMSAEHATTTYAVVRRLRPTFLLEPLTKRRVQRPPPS
jgi:hypothetical protein